MSVRDSENSPLVSSSPLDASIRDPDDDTSDSESPIEDPNKKCNLLIVILSLLVVIMIMMLIVIVLLLMGNRRVEELGDKVLLSIVAAGNRLKKTECMTRECAVLSAQLMNWRDEKIDPCEDFYEAACGRYQEHSDNDGTRAGEKEIIVRRLIQAHILKNLSTTSKSENALKFLHEKCDEIENRPTSKASLQKVYEEVLIDIAKIGRWPILDKNWTSDEDYGLNTVNKMMLTLSEFGVQHLGLFEITVTESTIKDMQKQLVIHPVNSRITENAVHPQDLKNTLEQILMRNNVSYDKNEFDQDFENYMGFLKGMEKYQNSTYLAKSFDELISEQPEIPFEAIIQNFINPKNGTKWDKLRPRIITSEYDLFFNQSDNIMDIINNTEPRILTNLMIFKFVEKMFYPMILRKGSERGRDEKACMNLMITALPRAALRVYVRNYFSKPNLMLATEMVESIKESFNEVINGSKWLSDARKANATRKVEKMEAVVGYSPEYEKPGFLDEMFETLHYSPNETYYSLMLKIQKFKTEQMMDFLISNSTLNPSQPLINANAYYYAHINRLDILIPFLDNPLFGVTLPKYATMSGTGRVMAHEVGHAFDYYSRKVDTMSSRHLWFDKEMNEEYQERVVCLVEQYLKMEPGAVKYLNGSQIISEMIADSLGAQAQWRAYKKMDMTGEQYIHGFEDVPYDKMYFYIGALDFCSPRKYSESIPPSTHPTNRFRINGVYANMKGFADAFKCPLGSPMNPEKKCQFF